MTPVSIFGHGRAARRAVLLGVVAAQPVYRSQDAEHTVLYGVVREHLDDFRRAAGTHEDGSGLSSFIEREFRGSSPAGVPRTHPACPFRSPDVRSQRARS